MRPLLRRAGVGSAGPPPDLHGNGHRHFLGSLATADPDRGGDIVTERSTPGIPGAPDLSDESEEAPAFDPLRLCIFATVAALGWLLGPLALLFFAALGFVGYAKARRAGLTRSKCLLGDTRIVLAYLAALTLAAATGIVVEVQSWLT